MLNIAPMPPFWQTDVMCRAVDNLELLLSQPDESVDLIYCDILYGTGRNFGDYQDLKAFIYKWIIELTIGLDA